MTSDALDRAAQAAFARWSDRLTWADLDETFGQAWRAQTAAALRVMGQDFQAVLLAGEYDPDESPEPGYREGVVTTLHMIAGILRKYGLAVTPDEQ